MEQVRIVEGAPRGGLQNEKQNGVTRIKLELIDRLAGCGLRAIEVNLVGVAEVGAADG